MTSGRVRIAAISQNYRGTIAHVKAMCDEYSSTLRIDGSEAYVESIPTFNLSHAFGGDVWVLRALWAQLGFGSPNKSSRKHRSRHLALEVLSMIKIFNHRCDADIMMYGVCDTNARLNLLCVLKSVDLGGLPSRFKFESTFERT
jgi:hypothetical protein